MFELSASKRVLANEGGSYIAYDVRPGVVKVAKLPLWPFLTPNIMGPEGNEQAEKLLRDIMPAGMTMTTAWDSDLGVVALIKGDRGTGTPLPLSEVAKRWLEMLAEKGNDLKLAKAELKRQTVIDDQGNPGAWVKGIQ